MLSSVSKLADKNFIIGFFIPALLAVMATSYVFRSIPWVASWFVAITSDKSFVELTYLAVAVWVLALLLLILNYELYRVLEGYTPPLSWLSGMVAKHRKKAGEMRARHDELIASGDRHGASKISWVLNKDYPLREDQFLPTRFGNRIRAFEMYSNDVYGADAVTLWTRLGMILPKQCLAVVDDARAEVNFMMNCFYIAVLLGLASISRLAIEWFTCVTTFPSDGATLAVAAGASALISYFAYLMATARVVAWGEAVESAFDCFLPALAKQLGYALPPLGSQRKVFWDDITRLLLYRRQLDDGRWPPS
jgi:hypothetical protein